MEDFTFGIEICEDLFPPVPVNQKLALGGANIIVNPAACNHTVGKSDYCKRLVSDASARLNCGYILASSGMGESTTDTVYSGLALIAENGKVIAENKPFCKNGLIISEIDVKNLSAKRRKNTSFKPNDSLCKNYFNQDVIDTEITRHIDKNPFWSCGVDSSELAEEILAITMPCFGTTKRTRSNSQILCKELGVDFKEINIADSVKQLFNDIGHSETQFDVTYENSQARERTQVLMDIANRENVIVVGTGDLSELALDWATYNGDRMSMYEVNAHRCPFHIMVERNR